jgi:hypothetical protein
MSTGLAFANAKLHLIANGTAIANLADNAASSPLTSLYWALHTADPTSGDQTTNEISYTGYARVAVARNSCALVVTGNTLSPAADTEFAAMTGGTDWTVTHASLGTLSSGAGMVLWAGELAASQNVTVGAQPIIGSGSRGSFIREN